MTARHHSIVLSAIGLSAMVLRAQPAFEVASVKWLPPPPPSSVRTGGGPGTNDPTRIIRSNVSLMNILMQAFEVQGSLIEAPDWTQKERYEIIATVPAGATQKDIPAMFRQLLVERFHMAFHRERRNMPVYELRVAKGGARLTAAGNAPASVAAKNGFPALMDGLSAGSMKIDQQGMSTRILTGAMTIRNFADYIAGRMDRPVIDTTKMSGTYEFALYYEFPPDVRTSDVIEAALRDELGLELHGAAAEMEKIVIDSIDRIPTPN